MGIIVTVYLNPQWSCQWENNMFDIKSLYLARCIAIIQLLVSHNTKAEAFWNFNNVMVHLLRLQGRHSTLVAHLTFQLYSVVLQHNQPSELNCLCNRSTDFLISHLRTFFHNFTPPHFKVNLLEERWIIQLQNN